MVVVNHEAPGILPVLVEGGCDRGGFVELLALSALAPPDTAILFGAAWLDDLHGNAALLEKFFGDAAELGAVGGLAPLDDDREGLEDALEGRPHVVHRKGGDEFGGDQFRDRIADCQLIDPAPEEPRRNRVSACIISPDW